MSLVSGMLFSRRAAFDFIVTADGDTLSLTITPHPIVKAKDYVSRRIRPAVRPNGADGYFYGCPGP